MLVGRVVGGEGESCNFVDMLYVALANCSALRYGCEYMHRRWMCSGLLA